MVWQQSCSVKNQVQGVDKLGKEIKLPSDPPKVALHEFAATLIQDFRAQSPHEIHPSEWWSPSNWLLV